MNSELLEALDLLEKEKNIPRETLLEAIKQSILMACKATRKGAKDARDLRNSRDSKDKAAEPDNVVVEIDPETCDYDVYETLTVVDEVKDKYHEISLTDAQLMDPKYQLGDTVRKEIDSKNFGRIAAQNAKSVILQIIHDEERKSLLEEYKAKEHQVVIGVVQRYVGNNVSVNLGDADAMLMESQMIHTRTKGPNGEEIVKVETFEKTQRIKVYVTDVRESKKGLSPRITVSRTDPNLVRCLFENEVPEVRDGTVEIRAIAREAGSRTKIAVYSNDPDADPVGSCVGVNGSRVNMIVAELGGEKVDIINWDENPAVLIENALSPAKVIYVGVDPDEKQAEVVVPDYQLSLAIGKEGQNARLAARLTGYKIDIKDETKARESGELLDYEEDYYDEDEEYGDEYEDEYDEGEYEDDQPYEDADGPEPSDEEAYNEADGSEPSEEAAGDEADGPELSDDVPENDEDVPAEEPQPEDGNE